MCKEVLERVEKLEKEKAEIIAEVQPKVNSEELGDLKHLLLGKATFPEIKSEN